MASPIPIPCGRRSRAQVVLLPRLTSWSALYRFQNQLNRIFRKFGRERFSNCNWKSECDSLIPSDSGGTDGQMQQVRCSAVENSASSMEKSSRKATRTNEDGVAARVWVDTASDR